MSDNRTYTQIIMPAILKKKLQILSVVEGSSVNSIVVRLIEGYVDSRKDVIHDGIKDLIDSGA